jgi:hypothetical protein
MGRTLHFVHGHEVSPFLVVRPETYWQQVLPVGANVPCEHLYGIGQAGSLVLSAMSGQRDGYPDYPAFLGTQVSELGAATAGRVGQFESVPLRKQVLSCFAVDRG